MSPFPMQPLFDAGSIVADAQEAPEARPATLRDRITAAAATEARPTDTVLSREDQHLAAVMPPLAPGRDIVAVSAGAWALHDLTRHLVRQTGPADFRMFTWSLTMPAAQTLVRLQADGLLRAPRFVMDNQMSKWSREALAWLTTHFARTYTCGIHAKGLTLGNDAWTVTVVTSANASNNPRVEAYHISTDPEVYAFTARWFDALIDGREPFRPIEQLDLQPAAIAPAEVPAWRGDLILFRGLPGAGKSTLARTIAAASPAALILEADQFFTRPDGSYHFVEDGLPLAHSWCLSEAQTAMAEGRSPVIIANTLTTAAEVDVYRRAARAHRYRCHVSTVENWTGTESIHAVSPQCIGRMRAHYEIRLGGPHATTA